MSFYEKHKSFLQKIDGLFLGNTVLERGLVVAPVIVVSTSLKNSLTIAAAYAVITFLTVLCTSFLPKKLPYTIRVILCVLFASIVYIPVAYFLEKTFPLTVYEVGIFLPLLAVNSLIVRKSETRFFTQKRSAMVLDLICSIVGFMLVICLIGTVRELLGSGTIWDVPLSEHKLPGILFPFSGFILVGFCSAALQKLRNRLTENREKE